MTRVLIIEDDVDNRLIVKSILESEGYNVAFSQILPRIEHVIVLNPDIILMDLWINGEFSGDLCYKLKSTLSTSHIPIILISGHSQIAEVAKKNNADAYIAKPLNLNSLIKLVEQLAYLQR